MITIQGKVLFYNIITHTRLRAILEGLASWLELAISQLLLCMDYGIKVRSKYLFFPIL